MEKLDKLLFEVLIASQEIFLPAMIFERPERIQSLHEAHALQNAMNMQQQMTKRRKIPTPTTMIIAKKMK